MPATARQTRKIVHIDPDKCNGCGVCIPSCHEGAIRIIDGKARLVGDNLCDGLGNCLATCPRGAITTTERPAEAFDETAVKEHLANKTLAGAFASPCAGGCPSAAFRELGPAKPAAKAAAPPARVPPTMPADATNGLAHWPVQLTLLPEQGRIWQDADVVFAADCVAFAMPNFRELLAGRSLAVCCPKLDDTGSYLQKLTRIFARNEVRSITIVHMEVPCCGGLERVVRAALANVGKDVPIRTVEVGIDGRIKSAAGNES